MDHKEQSKIIVKSFKENDLLKYKRCIKELLVIPSSHGNQKTPKYLIFLSQKIYIFDLEKKEIVFESKDLTIQENMIFFSKRQLLLLSDHQGLLVYKIHMKGGIRLEKKEEIQNPGEDFSVLISNVNDPNECIGGNSREVNASLYSICFRTGNVSISINKLEIKKKDNGPITGKIKHMCFSRVNSNILYFGGGVWRGEPGAGSLKKLNLKNRIVEKELLKNNSHQIFSIFVIMNPKRGREHFELMIVGTSQEKIYILEDEKVIKEVDIDYALCITKLNKSFLLMGTGWNSYHIYLFDLHELTLQELTTEENKHKNDINQIVFMKNRVFSCCFNGTVKIWEIENPEHFDEFEEEDFSERVDFLITGMEKKEEVFLNFLIEISLESNTNLKATVTMLCL